MRSIKSVRKTLLVTVLGGALAASLGIVITPTTTTAAYTDTAYTKSDELTADVSPIVVQSGNKFRSVDTAGGIGTDGNVYLWGYLGFLSGRADNRDPVTGKDYYHQLYNGPTKVVGLPEGKITALTGQIYDANALDSDGYVWGWGYHSYRNGTGNSKTGVGAAGVGQIRIGGISSSNAPLLDQVQAIGSSEMAGAAIRADGSIYRWGYDCYGGSTGYYKYGGAEQVPGLPDPNANNGERFPVAIYGGYTNFWTILANGEVWFWGGDSSMPKADRGYSGSHTAQISKALAPWFKSNVAAGDPYIVQVAGGIGLGQALLSNGQVLTWGTDKTRAGSRGGSAYDPAILPQFSNVVEITSGFTGMMALTSNGELWGFGASDDYGKNQMTPSRIDTNVVWINAGQGYYTWGKTDGTYWGKGYNPRGAIGLPLGTQKNPRQISWDLSNISTKR